MTRPTDEKLQEILLHGDVWEGYDGTLYSVDGSWSEINYLIAHHKVFVDSDGTRRFERVPRVLPGVGELHFVAEDGGEGQGDEIYFVFKVIFEDGSEQLYRVDGYYSSYNGTDWSSGELCPVEVVQRLVNFYE